MGKPRMIILVRHAQSEGNKNRDIHQYIPDHRVKLTTEGWSQAEDAGRRLRSMLKPDDTLQFFTSPYRRTRETTEGILRTLTIDDAKEGPSPFPRHNVKVYEEPRLREQDFGNFQPCSAEMERMWQERADYGHFFYRIPNGESAADAYDRISGFNESLWRSFGEADFPSVCVLVTHGLMTRVFLMKWYHWSVEYFEDLRNVNHCEFIVMKQNSDNGKYILQNQLRTWSDLKRRAALANGLPKPATPNPYSTPTRRWGGCALGCNHDKWNFRRKPRRQNTQDFLQQPPPSANEGDDHPIASQDADKAAAELNIKATTPRKKAPPGGKSVPAVTTRSNRTDTATGDSSTQTEPLAEAVAPAILTSPTPTEDFDGGAEDTPEELASESSSEAEELEGAAAIPTHHLHPEPQIPHRPSSSLLMLPLGRDFGGSMSGMGSPNDISDDSDYFDTNIHQLASRMSIKISSSSSSSTSLSAMVSPVPRSLASRSLLSQLDGSGDTKPLPSITEPGKSVNGTGKQSGAGKSTSGGTILERRTSRKTHGRKGSLSKTKTEKEWVEESGMTGEKKADALGDVTESVDSGDLDDLAEDEVERMKERDRKSFSEVY